MSYLTSLLLHKDHLMVVFPNAKINLGLDILRKRDDGYHDIETVFIPVKLADVLEIVPSKDKTVFTSTGLVIPDDGKDNLVVRAWQLLNEKHGIDPVQIHLHKIIPIGAGLGGGSSDAAFMLKALNDLFKLNCSFQILEETASLLGSDCTFFIRNEISFAQGRGEKLRKMNVPLENYKILIVNPGMHVSTAAAYSGVIPREPDIHLSELAAQPPESWIKTIQNGFETTVFRTYPEIKKLKEDMLKYGAVYAAMSGSGSSVYGIFDDSIEIPEDLFPEGYFIWHGHHFQNKSDML